MPLFSTLGAFAEARWRMSEYVMPNAVGAPKPSLETRVGLSFKVGSGGAGLASLAEALIATAESYIGTPFRRGGSSPSGFDSWGFVRFFGRLGVNLPSQQQQSEIGSRVRPEWRALAPGDLVLFEDERGVEHVAIYAGKSRIIHGRERGRSLRRRELRSRALVSRPPCRGAAAQCSRAKASITTRGVRDAVRRRRRRCVRRQRGSSRR